MIIKRLGEGISNQDWFVVGVEIMIVVVGIFIGLQVDDWNDARKDRRSEQLLLTYLAEDLENEVSLMRSIISNAEQKTWVLEKVIETAGSSVADSLYRPSGNIRVETSDISYEDDPQTNAFAHVFTMILISNRSTYDTMVSSGAIETISDVALARAIHLYYANIDQTILFEERLLFTRNELLKAETAAGLSIADEISIGELGALAAQNPAMLASMKNFWAFSQNHKLLTQNNVQRAEELMAEIRSRLTN